MLRLLSAATVLSLGTVAFLALAAPRLYTGFEERAIRAELQMATPGDTLDVKTQAALDSGDISGANQLAALAVELGKPLSPETVAALEEAHGTVAVILRNSSEFAGAFFTGRADSAAGLAGAVFSDLTVVGDMRDIISEGGKAAVGEDYSKFLLTLATIGLAAEGVTIATGGTSLVFNAGVSMLKVAKKSGNLTVRFANRLVALATVAARRTPSPRQSAPVERVASLGAAVAGRGAGEAGGLTRAAARAELRQAMTAVSTMADNAGAADAVKLMRHVNTTEDAAALAAVTSRFGRRSRAVVELTGKTALRGFRTAVRGVRLLMAFLWSLAAWICGLIALRLVKSAVKGTFWVVKGIVMAPVMLAR
ncbi:MAG: hypothetical protein AAGJ94_08445 [Pseudomonadota bacterium]